MTGDVLDGQWIPSPKAAASKVADETVLLHLESGTYFGLDPLGSRIWRSLSEDQNLRTLSLAIASEHEVKVEQVEADMREFLRELLDHGLIDAR